MHNTIITKLIKYGQYHLDLTKYNSIYATNQLLELFNQEVYKEVHIDTDIIKSLETPDVILNECFSYLVENNLCNKYEDDIYLTKIMGIISPTPDFVTNKFNELYSQNTILATNYLYNLGIRNYYIKQNAISNNQKWNTNFIKDNLEITINLSKPEKDNKEIAKLIKSTNKNDYPNCMLCLENLGFTGKINYPARQTLRFIPLKLNNENWFMQYSPYAYFDEHLICINENHTPMKVDTDTIVKLLDFVDYFPHYFIGSNAALPIIGGSILNHEHFQGGLYKLPMMSSTVKRKFKSTKYNIEVSELNWYAKSIRVTSTSRKDLEKFGVDIINVWNNYTDETINIYSHSNGTKHNSLSPICYKNGSNYVLDIIFRNNKNSEEYPDGIYHAHPQYHNIKKEGIGLIEAMGLFILPGRLKKEISEMCVYLTSNNSNLIKENSNLYKHKDMILELSTLTNISKDNVYEVVINHINETCKNILSNISVFKNDILGNNSFDNLIKLLNLVELN